MKRLMASALAASTVLVGVTALAAGTAQAATATVDYICSTVAFGANYDSGDIQLAVEMTSPPTVDPGEPIPVTYAIQEFPLGLPFPLTGVDISTSATVSATELSGSPSTSSSSSSSAPTTIGAVAPYGTVPVASSIVVSSAPFVVGDKVRMAPASFRVDIEASDQFGASGAYVDCTPTGVPDAITSTTIFGPPPVDPDDACVAQTGDTTGPPGCDTVQVIQLDVTAGRLTQRAYATGVNSSPTAIELGSLTSPLAPTAVPGDLNEITVTDNRGGTFGWSLTATLTDFVGVGGNTISRAALSASPACSPATALTAFDYDDPGQTPIAGFDPASSASSGLSSGLAGQDFGATVQLCNKNTVENLETGSTGGIYNVTAPLVLTMPAFQASDTYTAVLTVTLA